MGHTEREPVQAALYARVLGASWADLAEAVRRLHGGADSARREGTFRIRHGRGLLCRLIARTLGLPASSETARAQLIVEPLVDGERWVRSFDGRLFISTQWEVAPGVLGERVGPMEFEFRLRVLNGALVYEQVTAALSAGPLRLPLPARLAPRVAARETPAGPTRVQVQVTVSAPGCGQVLSYEGLVEVGEPQP